MGHSNIWNSHPKNYGPGSRTWYPFLFPSLFPIDFCIAYDYDDGLLTLIDNYSIRVLFSMLLLAIRTLFEHDLFLRFLFDILVDNVP